MEFLLIFVLILLNGFFSMSEVALISSKKIKLESNAKKGDKKAAEALKLASNPDNFLSTVQIGITLIGLLVGMLSGERFAVYLTPHIEKISFLAPYASGIASTVILIIITFVTIVFGELFPKRIGMMYPEKIASAIAKIMTVISKVTRPFIWLLENSNELLIRIFGLKKNAQENYVSEEEIKAMIRLGAEYGDIQAIEQNIIDKVFFLGDRRVSELMTPKRDIAWLDINDDLDTIRSKARENLHSMYPVSEGELDDLKGVVYLRDIFPNDLKKENFDLKNHIRKPLVVSENLPVYNVIEKFKERNMHYALVADEYGSIEGLISVDDALDLLISNEEDRVEDDEYTIIQRDDFSWLADGQLPFFEFVEYFDLPEENFNKVNFNTLGGLILEEFAYLPQTGEKLHWKDFVFEIIDLDGLRIDKILITRDNKNAVPQDE